MRLPKVSVISYISTSMQKREIYNKASISSIIIHETLSLLSLLFQTIAE